jgi:hypothetical protein
MSAINGDQYSFMSGADSDGSNDNNSPGEEGFEEVSKTDNGEV